jgi:hypothetical protein
MTLIEERNAWRKMFEEGHALDHVYMNEYRTNRDSELWRSTRALEQMCEYILYLEAEVEELSAEIRNLGDIE